MTNNRVDRLTARRLDNHSRNGGSIPTSTLSTDARLRLLTSIDEVMSYLMLTRYRIAGYTYGSERLVSLDGPKLLLCQQIRQRYLEKFGDTLFATNDDIVSMWSDRRKFHYKDLRDQKILGVDNGQKSMFNDSIVEFCGCVIYAYLGFNARANRRLIKIGYTGQPLAQYLKTKEIPHDPMLLATKPGGRTDESVEHQKYRNFLDDGREWFLPVKAIFNDLRAGWNLEPNFDELERRVLDDNN